MRSNPELEKELDERLDALGYELVQLIWAGNERKPILRVRIDRVDGGDGSIGVDDCAVVSRALEPWLDDDSRLPDRYVLEVSSPGVERPLVRPRDFDRFRGERVAIKGNTVLCDRARRLEGTLLGYEGEGEEGWVLLRLNGGDEVRIPRASVTGAHLVYEWKKS